MLQIRHCLQMPGRTRSWVGFPRQLSIAPDKEFDFFFFFFKDKESFKEALSRRKRYQQQLRLVPVQQ
jgi:hypothetical protein